MCRLAFFPKGMFDVMERNYVVWLLKCLEESRGGDGNGFYFLADDVIRKSTKLSINRLIKKGRWKHGFLFHTRLATHGDCIRRNTHPFRLLGGEVMVHNGIWNLYKVYETSYKCKTDTDSEVLGLYLQDNDWFIEPNGSSTVLAKTKKNTLAVCVQRTGSLVVCRVGDYHWLQSEAPLAKDAVDDWWDVEPGSYEIDLTSEGVASLPEEKITYITGYNKIWHWDDKKNDFDLLSPEEIDKYI